MLPQFEELLAIHARVLRSPDGEIVVQAIDEAARQSPEFRSALHSVYLGTTSLARSGRDWNAS